MASGLGKVSIGRAGSQNAGSASNDFAPFLALAQGRDPQRTREPLSRILYLNFVTFYEGKEEGEQERVTYDQFLALPHLESCS